MYVRKNILLMIILVVGNSVLSQTQTEIPKGDLPKKVTGHLYKKYNDYWVENIVKITDHGEIRIYKLEVHKKTNRNRRTIEHICYLTYDANGKLMLKLKTKKIYYNDSTPSKKKFLFGNDRRDLHKKEN